MIRSLISALVLAVACSHFATAQTVDQPETLPLEGVAALVNDEPISFFDVRQRARMLMVTLGAQPSEEVFQQLASTALEQLVDERLQLQAAAEFELEISEDRIHDSINRIAQQSGSTMETLESEFNQAGISMRTLEEQVRADMAWQDIMRGRHGRNIRISPDRINRQMDLFKSDSENTAYQLAEIFLFAPDEESRIQAHTAAYTLIEQLRGGTPFQAMAQQISRAPTAAAGGDMGWVSLEDLDPAVASAVASTVNPGVIEPILVEDGVYIISVRGRRDPQESISVLSLMQIVATDDNIKTLETAMDRIDGCENIKAVADARDTLVMADLGTVNLTELSAEAQEKVTSLKAGELSSPFKMSRGWASIAVCNRHDGAANLPSNDQVENQLYGRELGMISDRELRNARLEATILR